uniref:Spt6 SH2 domain-containing protein n=1 Tax=Ditylenchus dipsaci TaxID=166011 RepID=A0A915DR51_9BILA
MFDLLICISMVFREGVDEADLKKEDLKTLLNEAGVDVNRCLEFPHMSSLFQFVSERQFVRKPRRLVDMFQMGLKVFMNAAAFILIDTSFFAAELCKQGSTIKAAPEGKELFEILFKGDTYPDGKLVKGRVMRVLYRKPEKEDDLIPLQTIKRIHGSAPTAELLKITQLVWLLTRTFFDAPDSFRHPSERLTPNQCQYLRKETAPTDDPYFDEFRFKQDEDQKKKTKLPVVTKDKFAIRGVTHPSFKNCSYKEAESILSGMDQLATRHSMIWMKLLFVTLIRWLGCSQHNGSAKVLPTKCQLGGCQKVEMHLMGEKRKMPSRIPYVITASTKHPAMFVLSYIIQQKLRHEYLAVERRASGSATMCFRPRMSSSTGSRSTICIYQ